LQAVQQWCFSFWKSSLSQKVSCELEITLCNSVVGCVQALPAVLSHA
jgi:hypothetical protein